MSGGGCADDSREWCPGPAEADGLSSSLGRKTVPPVRRRELEADLPLVWTWPVSEQVQADSPNPVAALFSTAAQGP